MRCQYSQGYSEKDRIIERDQYVRRLEEWKEQQQLVCASWRWGLPFCCAQYQQEKPTRTQMIRCQSMLVDPAQVVAQLEEIFHNVCLDRAQGTP